MLRRRAIAGRRHRSRAGRSRLVHRMRCRGEPVWSWDRSLGRRSGQIAFDARFVDTASDVAGCQRVVYRSRADTRSRRASPHGLARAGAPAPCCDGDDLITRRVRVNDRASHAGAQLSASDCSAACGACAWHVACDASLKVDFWLGGVWMCGLSSTGCRVLRVLSPNVPLRPSESVCRVRGVRHLNRSHYRAAIPRSVVFI